MAETFEHLKPAHPGKIQIDNEQTRTNGVRIGVKPRHKADGLLAVIHHFQLNGQPLRGQRFFNQEDVGLIVLNEDDRKPRLSRGW